MSKGGRVCVNPVGYVIGRTWQGFGRSHQVRVKVTRRHPVGMEVWRCATVTPLASAAGAASLRWRVAEVVRDGARLCQPALHIGPRSR